MDQELVDRIVAAGGDIGKGVPMELLDTETGEFEIPTPSGPFRYILKPLQDLYGKGYGGPSVKPEDPHYKQLFLTIEQTIAEWDRRNANMRDSRVLLTLEAMSMNPAMACNDNELCRSLQVRLRGLLSGLDYSRTEIKTAIRTIARSVQRHKDTDGIRGYLDFIQAFF